MPRVCAVAGAGSGVGMAVARRFARESYAVALLARRQGALDRMAAELSAGGATARGFSVDLTDAAALRAVLDRVAAELGAPDVLVYNASGAFSPAPAMDLDPARFADQLNLCVTGALVAAQSVFPAMRAAAAGTILFTGGGLALTPEEGGEVAALTAGKAGLRALARAIAPELARAGIHVATVTVAGMIAPGGPFDPDRIAETYWELHTEPSDAWTVERIFRGTA